MPRLGVNIDHVATIRQARRTVEPDPVAAAVLAELAGADGITVHLREDRRHIQDRDVELLRRTVRTRFNLEMAATDEMVAIATRICPDQVTLVPERREEITTEGGLDVAADLDRLRGAVLALRDAGIAVSLFIDPELSQVAAAKAAGADQVELHTGQYASATLRPGWSPPAGTDDLLSGRFRPGGSHPARALARLESAGAESVACGLVLAAGHGLTYWNVGPVAGISGMEELNIGHCIVSRAVLVGFERAVREMKEALEQPPSRQGR
ncbi:MAG: pyridoxine 5'-phosphate synthase [Candidatus Sericytochromatia bacterium]|nr:pyridoxine 5'-phosphate synthase [Candidatus Tanganyikabacteria bacterium]